MHRPFGPEEMPDARPEISRVSLADVYDLADAADEWIAGQGALPCRLRVGNSSIGSGSLYALFCAAYLDMVEKDPDAVYAVPVFDPYPKTNEEIIVRRIEGYKRWPVHREDLDMNGIIENTRLQLWTLKPAQAGKN